MKCNSRSKVVLAALLAMSLLTTACNPQWISVALADLPVLVQMALNIGTMVTTVESGQQLSAEDAAAIQSISNEASKDLNLLQTLCNEYKGNGDAATIQKIQSVVADIDTNLPALLQSAHIRDAALSARISSAVNLVVTTVNNFAALMPNAAPAATKRVEIDKQKMAVPHPKDLKKQWNQQVCGSTGKSGIENPLAGCVVR
jgi:hypothetical protein